MSDQSTKTRLQSIFRVKNCVCLKGHTDVHYNTNVLLLSVN